VDPDPVMERTASFTSPNGVGVHQTIVTLKETRENLIQTFFELSRPLNSDPLKIQQGKRTCYWSADRNDASCEREEESRRQLCRSKFPFFRVFFISILILSPFSVFLLFSFLGLPEEWKKLIEREQDFILTAKV
jgi:hypothetical protein